MNYGFLFFPLCPQGLTFTETNIKGLQQINCLSLLRRLEHLSISSEGNPITSFTLWKPYVLFRLTHFSLRKINDVEVSFDHVKLLWWTRTQKSGICEKGSVFFSCRTHPCLVLVPSRLNPRPVLPCWSSRGKQASLFKHVSSSLFSVIFC